MCDVLRSILVIGILLIFGITQASVQLPGNNTDISIELESALHTSRTALEIDTINVEVDYMVGDDHSHELLQPEIDALVNMFACQGIVLNIEISDVIPHVDVIGNDNGNVFGNMTPLTGFGWIKAAYCDHLGEVGWHYCVMAHMYDGGYGTGSSGLAELLGDDFIVSLGAWWTLDEIGTPFDRAAIFAHELGHNLGLRHAGNQDQNVVGTYKPNYASIMTYRYSLQGVRSGMMCEEITDTCSPFRNLDYSHGSLSSINENALDETVGIGYGPVDWNCNGIIDQVPVSYDLASFPFMDNGSYQVLTDYDDWSNITDATYTVDRDYLDHAEVVGCLTYEEYTSKARYDGDYCVTVPIIPEPCTYVFTDSDGDGIGDICDQCPGSELNDEDGDGVCSDIDNCPYTPNPDQTDINNNGLGDKCECTNPARTYLGEAAGDMLGWRVNNAGDFNRDGYDDLIVGASANDFIGSNAGCVYVYSGRTGALLVLINGEYASDYFGFAVDGAGDVNLDGYADIIVGANSSSATGTYAGRVYLFYGYPVLNADTISAVDADMIFNGLEADDNLGGAVAGIGNVDHQPGPDLLMSARQQSGNFQGKVYVYSGQSGELVYSYTGEAPGHDFGCGLANAGDFNNDGVEDFIIGAQSYYIDTDYKRGCAYIYSGLDGSLLVKIPGADEFNFFGWAVSSTGDLNSDGFSDVIIGAPLNDAGEPNGGTAYVFNGYSGPFPDEITTTSASMYFTGTTDLSINGYAVSYTRDLNDDGINELIVGEPQQPGGNSMTGRVHIYSGADGVELHTLESNDRNDMFGSWVCGSESSTSLHTLDLIIGSYISDINGSDAGSAHVYMFGDQDNDAILDNCDNCPSVANFNQIDLNGDGIGDACQFICGDANSDASVNVSDAVYIINFVFAGGNPPEPIESGDANCDGTVNVSDAVYIINFVFTGGNPPGDPDGDGTPDC